MNLAIIPARGGSKRIPRKNIRAFRGKPIIGYAIRAALESGCFDEVMVSTDDAEIAEVAIQNGAKVPFMRSDKAADDHATTASVVREVLESYRERGHEFAMACCLYATAALVTPERLRQAKEMLAHDEEAEGVITLVRTPQPAVRALVTREGWVGFLMSDQTVTRSQDSQETFFDAAQMYWLKTKPFMAKHEKTMAFLRRLPLVLSEFETQDINTLEDWQLAEWKSLFLEEHPEILGLRNLYP
jgi:pseudaminic acid cytidylyltransferase